MDDDTLRLTIETLLVDDRNELWEEWNDDGTLLTEIDRLAVMAREIHEDRLRIMAKLSEEQLDPRIRQMRDEGTLMTLAATQAVWSATEADLEAQREAEAIEDELAAMEDEAL